jgi:hypothetical protein
VTTDLISPRLRMPAPTKQESKVHFMDYWMTSTGAGTSACVTSIATELEAHENRQRSRTERNLRNFKLTLQVLLSNIAFSLLTSREGDPRPIAVPMSKMSRKTRYTRDGFGQLPEIVKLLVATGWITKLPRIKFAHRTTITPAPKLAAMIERSGITLSSITWSKGREVIMVRGRDHLKRRHELDYKDTPITNTQRTRLEAINEFLGSADIKYDGDEAVHTGQRELIRHFNVKPSGSIAMPTARGFRFTSGGRLNGGWWQPLESAKRPSIRISGEPIADLDFSGMFPRLAALACGAGSLVVDPYTIEAFEQYRTPIKKLVNAMLFTLKPMKNWPRELGPSDFGGSTLKRMREAIHHHLPFMKDAEGRALGYDLMNMESEILMAALEAMMAAGIVALPMHDGVMVAASRADEAMAMMEKASEKVVSVGLKVVHKRLSGKQ